MNYKDTLLMPRTDFEMRANLAKKEPKILERWEELDIYKLMLEKNKGFKSFILHDGPPYANGAIHVGHALNKTLKDIVIRSKFKEKFYVPFIPGWDTHGLPIENAVIKLGFDRKTMPIDKFRAECEKYALEQVKAQTAGFKRLGSVGDYQNPYITLHKDFESQQVRIFGKMATEGLIYKGLKPVYWSPSSESALAEAEIEYKDVKSPSIYVKFPVKDAKNFTELEDAAFVIWTTTPWTLPANLAISLNPDYTYALIESEKGKLVVLESLVEELTKEFELTEVSILKKYKGLELEYITCQHPLYDRESLVILGNHVTADSGTGCVHTAPGHGNDDFIVGLKYGLEPYCPVDEKGVLDQSTGEFAGLFYEKANKVVVAKLDELGLLLKLKFIEHAYPHDWRSKKPIIFRATPQWFASIEKIRDSLLKEIDNVTWFPKWGQIRMHNMIKERGDWCISRQRLWGVPIPIIYDESKNPIIDAKLFEHFSNLFREYGSNIWYEKSINELLPQGYTHPGSPNNIFYQETDTMDVWFDSGSSHTGVLVERGLNYPCDLYLEGSDQYRGWFNSSLIIGQAMHGQAPYRQVVSHGFIMAAKGEKMSKSLGNSIDPNVVMDSYGADILRLWVASVDYQADSRISDDILKQVSENYRKIRNTFRFILGNISDLDQNDLVDINNLPLTDKYILIQLSKLNKTVRNSYSQYDFNNVTVQISNFITNVISAYYLDYTKDILYIEKAKSPRRLQVQTVLHHVYTQLLSLIAPILVYTAEELNSFYPIDPTSVHLAHFIDALDIADSELILSEMEDVLKVRNDVYKSLELARAEKVIGKSLEAKVTIYYNNDKLKYLLDKYLANDLAQFFIVSKTQLVCADQYKIETEKAEGFTCERCWNVTERETLCDRCQKVLNG